MINPVVYFVIYTTVRLTGSFTVSSFEDVSLFAEYENEKLPENSSISFSYMLLS